MTEWSKVTRVSSGLGPVLVGGVRVASRGETVNLEFNLADGTSWLIQCGFSMLATGTLVSTPQCTISGSLVDGTALRTVPSMGVTTGASLVTLTDTTYVVRFDRIDAPLETFYGHVSAGSATANNVVITLTQPRGGLIAGPSAYRSG